MPGKLALAHGEEILELAKGAIHTVPLPYLVKILRVVMSAYFGSSVLSSTIPAPRTKFGTNPSSEQENSVAETHSLSHADIYPIVRAMQIGLLYILAT